jgi:hypothetical protein
VGAARIRADAIALPGHTDGIRTCRILIADKITRQPPIVET